MKQFFFTLLVLLSLQVIAQNEYNERLRTYDLRGMGVSPEEKIWFFNYHGTISHVDNINQLWRTGRIDSLYVFGYQNYSGFEVLYFFSEDTMLFAGELKNEDFASYIFWTGNGGKSWEKIDLGYKCRVEAFYADNKGNIWLGGDGDYVFCSKDYGKTWKNYPSSVAISERDRISSLFFTNDLSIGLAGSLQNTLFKTTDKCKTWQPLPTPLSQGKYKPFDERHSPKISNIGIIGKQYIVKQEDRVFISDTDDVQWEYLPEVYDFELTDVGNIYFIHKDYSVSYKNSELEELWHSKEKMKFEPYVITERNESLYVFNRYNLYKINHSEFVGKEMFTAELKAFDPPFQIIYNGKRYGFEDRDFFFYEKDTERWRRLKVFDFFIDGAAVLNDSIVVFNELQNTHYSISLPDYSIRETKLPTNLFNLAENPVVELKLINNNSGCFYTMNDTVIYKKNRTHFVKDRDCKYYSSFNPPLDSLIDVLVDQIDAVAVDSLVECINESATEPLVISDFQFTDEDVKNYLSLIDEISKIEKEEDSKYDYRSLFFHYRENVDYGFYKGVVDSLASISSQTLMNAFNMRSKMISTSSYEWAVVFVFEDGTELSVNNSDYKAKYLHTPWWVEYDGLRFKSTSVKYGMLLNQITDCLFLKTELQDKTRAIFRIADYLYSEKLKAE